jgi:tetratricopeptide (TPR) repeat protein
MNVVFLDIVDDVIGVEIPVNKNRKRRLDTIFHRLAFIDQLRIMIPSESYINFLKYFTAWFNKDLDKYIKQEYLLEIYGVSAFASDSFDFIGPNYDRILNYHAAHDIGHALQNLNLVKCTAFGVWDEKSSDSALLIGRNFDFYVGDAFAENKIILFVNPDNGYKFASITWGGMTGVVSGMNEKGLTVTLNSAKSDIPYGAKTPVSIIAREILQYASNIEEAMKIASAREAFVSESFLIGSAHDHKAVVIEKSTDTTVLYDPDTNFLILTNHFQSDFFSDTELCLENKANETSVYRHERVQELIDEIPVFDQYDAARLLRDTKGKRGKDIGLGNEKAINQLIAHHSIIFKPEERTFWISKNFHDSYVCYNLDSIFNLDGYPGNKAVCIYDLEIAEDSAIRVFRTPDEASRYLHYKQGLKLVKDAIKNKSSLENEEQIIEQIINGNPEFYYAYSSLGEYFEMLGNNEEAIKYYKLALTKEVASLSEKNAIKDRIESCKDE